jgi:hypothetical protein
MPVSTGAYWEVVVVVVVVHLATDSRTAIDVVVVVAEFEFESSRLSCNTTTVRSTAKPHDCTMGRRRKTSFSFGC